MVMKSMLVDGNKRACVVSDLFLSGCVGGSQVMVQEAAI